MREDEEEPSSTVDVAYDFIDEADDDWTKDELLAVLARAGFPLDHEAELDDILEAVRERLEYENIFSEATKMFLRKKRLPRLAPSCRTDGLYRRGCRLYYRSKSQPMDLTRFRGHPSALGGHVARCEKVHP